MTYRKRVSCLRNKLMTYGHVDNARPFLNNRGNREIPKKHIVLVDFVFRHLMLFLAPCFFILLIGNEIKKNE